MWKQNFNQDESEEEEDYMSDAFLSKCVEPTNDIRPGVPMARSTKRIRELENKKKELIQQKKKKVTQGERLAEGLKTAIDESNKGFAMLQKMGYKPGTSLGKEGSGRLEPVEINFKSDRKGLGLKEKLMEIKREKEQRYLARLKKQNLEFDPNKFREQKRLQMQTKQLEADLARCQRTCYRLDSEHDVSNPVEWYFWPSHLLPTNEEEEAEEEGGDEEEEATETWQTEIYLEVVIMYLRNAYKYCIYCGIAYTDEEDMANNCPGPSKADHDE